jgi:hypothetical protein
VHTLGRTGDRKITSGSRPNCIIRLASTVGFSRYVSLYVVA